MNRNFLYFIVSVAVSIVLHILILFSAFEVSSRDTSEKTEPFIRLVDAVLIDTPTPEAAIPDNPVPPEPEPPKEVIAADVQPEQTEADSIPEDTAETENQPAAQASGSGSNSPEDFLPFYRVDKRPEFIYKADLQYPLQAKRQKVEGTVILEADIDSSGTVRMIRIVKSAGFGFDEAALDMIERSTFSPASTGGLNVGVRMRFTINFEF